MRRQKRKQAQVRHRGRKAGMMESGLTRSTLACVRVVIFLCRALQTLSISRNYGIHVDEPQRERSFR